MLWRKDFIFFVHCALASLVIADNLNRCLQGKHHKESPGMEGAEFKKYYCSRWSSRSCCTSNSSQAIEEDGAVNLYRMKWDHCERNLSNACREWFRKDMCFYECSPNVGPWIVLDKKSKITRRERVLNVPVCASDCNAWFEDCKDDLTCSDNWNNWKWTKGGNTCIKGKECKTFKDYFKNPRNFCTKIFDGSFQYNDGTPGKDCLALWPNVSADGGNPNDNVAKVAQKKFDEEKRKSIDPKIVNFLNKCMSSKTRKKTPGPEGNSFVHCIPWRSHSCCTANTTRSIKDDGAVSLHNFKWDHCGNLSQACQQYFVKDTCFYECSPNLAPWIVKLDQVTTRKERFLNVPLCSNDCDGWFDACKDDLTCSDNWGNNWNWTSKGNDCNLGCKRFKDYFKDSVNFCNKIFDNSFAYNDGVLGKDCMTLWPTSNVKDFNREVAYLAAKHSLSSCALRLDGQAFLSIIILAVVLFKN